MDIRVTQAAADQRKKRPEKDSELGFGRIFTDHIFKYDFAGGAWQNPRIEPYGPLALDPACMVFHYAQEIFEGLKAYRGADNGIYLFRYSKNIERMRASAKRLCMPQVDAVEAARAIKELVLLDREWMPQTEGCALYIRPTMIATDPYLGVRPSQSYLFYVILCPVGAYYPQGFNPVSIMVHDSYVRAVEGGVGNAKTGGNYAASLLGQVEAQKQGFTQVLWLDAKEHRYVEEVGTMNIFFVFEDEIVTGPLTGSILPGVTRDSVLQLLREKAVPGLNQNYRVVERKVAIDEVIEGAQSGKLKEAFGTGTAAIVSPVGQVHYRGETHQVAGGQTGPLAQRLYDHLLAMQYGQAEDPFDWVERIDV